MWQQHDPYFVDNSSEDEKAVPSIYDRTCRYEFSSPGFALLSFGPDLGSHRLRQQMVKLKDGLSRLHRQHRGQKLVYTSMGRYDLQVTTKPHRDGGPDQSLLMLAYEPTPVKSRISLADYSRCAFEMGLTPGEFLNQFNPMFSGGQAALASYTTWLDAFDNTSYQILIVNNSISAFTVERRNWLGVLHTAEILNPMPEASRVVNSAMIASVDPASKEGLPASEQADFLVTDLVRKPVAD